MDRKSIFEILQEKIDFAEEIQRIEELLHEFDPRYGQLFGSINNVYKKWTYRGSTISISDLYTSLGFQKLLFESPDYPDDMESYIRYCEMIFNLCMIFYSYATETDKHKEFLTQQFSTVLTNIDNGLEKIGYRCSLYPDKEHGIVVQINATATAAAELVDEANAIRIMEYNRYLLKGNLQKKKEILVALGNVYEGEKDKLKKNNLGQLSDDIGCLLNNLNLRHNNEKGQKKSKIIAELSTQELEEWYDKTYKLILIAILSLEKINLCKEVAALKQKIAKLDGGE